VAGGRLSGARHGGAAARDLQDIPGHGLKPLQVVRVEADQAPAHVLQKSLGYTELRSDRLLLVHAQPVLRGPSGILVESWPLRQRGRRIVLS